MWTHFSIIHHLPAFNHEFSLHKLISVHQLTFIRSLEDLIVM